MHAGRMAVLAVVLATAVAGCGYIVTPEDDASPIPATSQGWTGIATKATAAAGALHIDITIRNDTGAWSAMQATSGRPAVLTAKDGTSTNCATVSVGTGGTSLAPGFQIRGYTGGSQAKPTTQLLSVECAGAAPAPGATLSIPYTYTTGDFNYYTPSAATSASLSVDLDKTVADLKYPVATPIDGVIEKANAKIVAINKCTLSLTSAKRTTDGLEFAWQADNPTQYPTYVHIGTPPVIGTDGVIYGFYQSPTLTDAPIAQGGQSAKWTTTVAVPSADTGLYILASVEDKQQKTFVNHAIDITDK